MSKATNRRGKAPSSSTTKKSDPQYPSPFTSAPSSIETFLPQLDPAQVYITHIDRHPSAYKRQIFLLAAAINASVALLLAWRLYIALPKYLALAQTFFGYLSAATVDTRYTTREQQLWILLRRTGMMLFDFLLFRFIGPWPLSFFFERPANPVTWRWRVRFEEQEVVVRVCRNWTGEDLMQGTRKGDQSPFFKTRIVPAIDPMWMQKTGYLMMGKDWDLDFGLMQDAHVLIREGKIEAEDLDMLVLAHQEGGGWLMWRFEERKVVLREDNDEANRKRMAAFKDMLSSKGKEDLFWSWQEIVEEERSVDGGFTPEAQTRVASRVAEEFARNGLDFAEATRSVAGESDMPAGIS